MVEDRSKQHAPSERCNQENMTSKGGLAYRYRPSALVTSTIFDNDEIFSAVAKALIFKHEVEGLSEEDSIKATLFTSEEKRAFLESLDLRNSTLSFQQDEELNDLSPINELMRKTRSIFGKTLQSLWQDSTSPSVTVSEENVITSEENHKYQLPLKTPKNLHSPIKTSCNVSNVLSHKSSGRQRRRAFFPDTCDQERSRPRMRLDFNLSNFMPAKSLHLDGFSNPESLCAYIPPSSPISCSNIKS